MKYIKRLGKMFIRNWIGKKNYSNNGLFDYVDILDDKEFGILLNYFKINYGELHYENWVKNSNLRRANQGIFLLNWEDVHREIK